MRRGRRIGPWGGGRISLLMLGMLSLLGCAKSDPGKAPASKVPHDVKRVILKFQDSSGWTEKDLPGDSLGSNLRAYVAALRAAPDTGAIPNDPEDIWNDPLFAGFDSIFSRFDACGCSSPSDSLEVELRDGRKEKYRMYCSDARRVRPDTTLRLRIDDINMSMLDSRWEALRLQYCPKRYGCGGVPRAGWRTGIRRRVDSAWVAAYQAPKKLGDSLVHLLEQAKDPDPQVELLVTLHVRDGVAERIVVDSVGARYAELADTLAARGLSGRVGLDDGAHQYRLIAFNYFLER